MMKSRILVTSLLILLSASPACALAQDAVNRGLLASTDNVPVLSFKSSNLDLGVQDGSAPLRGELTIFNADRLARQLLSRTANNVARLQFTYPENLTIAAGGSLSVPWQYDLHGVTPGEVQIKVALETDDPAAPKLEQTLLVNYQPQANVKPYRSAVLASMDTEQTLQLGDAVPFTFAPQQTGQNFVDAYVLDRNAPLQILEMKPQDNGSLTGAVQIDAHAILKGGIRSGETQVVGKMDSGSQSYFFIQWRVMEK